jgi:hypothetical protein
MRRHLLNLLSALPLLVFAGAGGLWVWSAGSRDVTAFVDLDLGARYLAVSALGGHLEVAYFPDPPAGYTGVGDYARWVVGRDPFVLGAYAGVVVVPSSPRATGGYVAVVPYWFLMLGAGAALAALRGRSWWRNRRRDALAMRGRCLACGYDLRATPGRCPECGRDDDGETARGSAAASASRAVSSRPGRPAPVPRPGSSAPPRP